MSPFLGPGTLMLLAGLLVGYATGRRHGLSTGFRQGLLFAPLELRRLNCEKGYCILCTAPAHQHPSPSQILTRDAESSCPDHPEENQ
jgi:hypothetical protein